MGNLVSETSFDVFRNLEKKIFKNIIFQIIYKEGECIQMITDEFVDRTLELIKSRYSYLKNNNISFHIHREKPNRNKATHSHIKSIYNRESKNYLFEIHLNISEQEEKSRT